LSEGTADVCLKGGRDFSAVLCGGQKTNQISFQVRIIIIIL
jgi:hypothetical protein